MDQSAAPWRAIEDAPIALGTGGGSGSPAARPHRASGALTHRPWTIGALGLAGLLGGAALVIALSNGGGSFAVDGAGRGADASNRATMAVVGSPMPNGTTAELVVDVQGAVARRGIVRLLRGARVADAIAAAGGYGPRVATDRIGTTLNLAAVVKDGDQVVVPSRDDPLATLRASQGAVGGGGGGGGGPTGPLDLNRATATELDGLPGVGPATAARIIAAREEQPFTSIDDLRTRRILGAAAFDKVKALVIVR